MATSGGFGDDERSVGTMFRQLLDDGRAYAQAEVELVKAKAEIKLVEFRGAIILGLVALFLGFAATVTLCLALVLWLSQLLGSYVGGALAVVIVGGAAAVVGYLAVKAFDRAAD